MCHRSIKYWRDIKQCATDLQKIGGTSSNVPPIHKILGGHQAMWHQSVEYWRDIKQCATDLQKIGGTSKELPPITTNIGGKKIFPYESSLSSVY